MIPCHTPITIAVCRPRCRRYNRFSWNLQNVGYLGKRVMSLREGNWLDSAMPQHQQSPGARGDADEDEDKSKELENTVATRRHSGAHDSTLGDGQSLAGSEAESLSGMAKAMPHEGGPPITQLEAVAALEQAEQGVEAGSGYSDDGYGTDGASATSQSLATSAREFIYEHGRRYHSYKADVNPYLFPNDDREQDREDLKHAMFLKLFNKTLHFAPVPSDANVLDLGTGTGK